MNDMDRKQNLMLRDLLAKKNGDKGPITGPYIALLKADNSADIETTAANGIGFRMEDIPDLSSLANLTQDMAEKTKHRSNDYAYVQSIAIFPDGSDTSFGIHSFGENNVGGKSHIDYAKFISSHVNWIPENCQNAAQYNARPSKNPRPVR